jgi:hypothetical protein
VSTSTEVIGIDPGSLERTRFLPVMSLKDAETRRDMLVQLIRKQMKPEVDYGKIPGTTKDVLLQPGADKLLNFLGLHTDFTIEKIEDWTGEQHGGEPFFYYIVKCRLYRGEHLMGEGAGSCNSWESKYRYRYAEKVCPHCGRETIIKGKQEYGGGWLCFRKKGGCGATFSDGDQSIEEQPVGRVMNPEIYNQVNTVFKMAQKRAKIAATLNATSAHEFFTQDLEDEPPAEGPSAPEVPPSAPPAPQPAVIMPSRKNMAMTPETARLIERIKEVPKMATWIEVMQEMEGTLKEIAGEDGGREYHRVLKEVADVEHSNQIKDSRMAIRTVVKLGESIERGREWKAKREWKKKIEEQRFDEDGNAIPPPEGE